ncbi:hypothetical protein [Paraburkholderia tropica]|uniref:hypothetical protein n=1 Tax=Paraburkholderia tropica TaxID=92647 RepID=UPI002AB2AC61|nr:hypothetical protein [Paraburkholderia tropica]
MSRGLSRYNIPTWVFLWGTLIVYSVAYLAHPALPGNNLTYPRGWWDWFDQGQYLREAKALALHDWSPDNFYYPVLYPLIGRVFLHWTPNHPFFVFDGFALLVFVYVFVKFADQYLSRVETLALTAGALWFTPTVMVNYAIPWTTSGTALVYSLCLLILMRQKRIGERGECNNSAAVSWALLFSMLFGALVVLRPVDAGVAAVFFPAYVFFTLPSRNVVDLFRQRRRVFLICGALGLGLVFWLLIFGAVNHKIFGRPLSGYMQSTASSSGYFVAELPRKVWSLVFDTNTAYLEPQAALVTHYPWLMLSIVGIAVVLVRGDKLLRVLALAILLHFALYAPYGDLLPEGMWRFHNVHYFKWAVPYLALLAWLAVRWVWSGSAGGSSLRIARAAAAVALISLVLCVQFKVRDIDGVSQAQETTPDGNVVVNVACSTNLAPVDFIDLRGLSGGFREVYFGSHQLWLDGQELRRVHDFRLLPAPWGVRLLFNRPFACGKFRILIGHELATGHADITGVSAGAYRLTLGRPRLPVLARHLEKY